MYLLLPMNNFIFENTTKTYFGKGCVKEYLAEELSKYGNRGDFVHKILVFEKINTDYYVLSLLDESELNRVKSLSRVWARNGSGTTSKAYGML